MDQWAGVVLAAGDGKRMKSRLTKVLHRVCGKELVRYPVDLMKESGVTRVVVVVSLGNRQAVQELLGNQVEYVTQTELKGTGDALSKARVLLQGQAENVLVLTGDAPLVRLESVKPLMAAHADSSRDMTFLTCRTASAKDFGRVARNEKGQVVKIVEAADQTGFTDEITEVNGSVYCFRDGWLWENLDDIPTAANGEKYITSLVEIGSSRDGAVEANLTEDPAELMGVNDRLQLSQVEEILRQRIREQWMLSGVTMPHPASVYIDAGASIGQDTVILPNTSIVGSSVIGEDCEIGPNSVIRDSTIGRGCRATASVLEEATMEDGANIGPFSHLRPGAYLESGVHLGNFVEVKESRFASGAVMGHFGYVGDASIGAGTNLGAGMVTCNYDGKDKHRTDIGENAFIGCDTMLVAPVTVGSGAITGAGAVVTKDVPAGRLAVGVPAKIRSRNPEAN
ncbi:MAG TPA: UDP-N-acetylglucosamine diphosphorylase/glucosamine-1-phosphate N-acetyltransferase [Dehalococcoidia bacterium]|jgi:bifunctional UDP-N-acetylglucosamine pyrophosphorylase/glucosamine-1-phosphate N-acetyltransferase|nr:UDP-N-acetylglucosamine diphosphorylase/glucosamine-1-phosphate N-acetyltransferase [Dehalococcoidia bacterium]|tara:strand:+ start:3420 stop:4778 length:1359 start_codon:yes stop_codon:yes gene_type:complete